LHFIESDNPGNTVSNADDRSELFDIILSSQKWYHLGDVHDFVLNDFGSIGDSEFFGGEGHAEELYDVPHVQGYIYKLIYPNPIIFILYYFLILLLGREGGFGRNFWLGDEEYIYILFGDFFFIGLAMCNFLLFSLLNRG
jgi:hypothetical protein